MTKFNAGDMIERTSHDSGGLRQGRTYKVVSTDGIWLTVINDSGNEQECLVCNSTLVTSPNQLKVGETYTSYNGHSWVAIYEEDDLVWMKSLNADPAYVFKKEGTLISLCGSQEFNINWEVTKGPIIEEGVYVTGGFHLGITDKGSYDDILVDNLTVTTVDGVPDWTTLACKGL
jgi:hypothetical protein